MGLIMLRTQLERLRSIMLELNILENEMIEVINNIEGMRVMSEDVVLTPPPLTRQYGDNFATPPE